jgi:UDP-N-acetylglucosamine--N-acetylmuramyl-(pentapeptide) pyrophosphoryl-undecaprenol N-acetylglucosamine transferase
VNSESTIGTSDRPLRIVIAGGGTGGHVSPGVAVIEELRSRLAIETHWIGSSRGYEHETAEQLSIQFHAVQVGKLRRYASFSTLIDAGRIPVGVVQAWRHLRAIRPDLIFSTGGYVSSPVVFAGRLLRIPSMTHEQTAYIGLATRINARFVDVVALSYERSRAALGSTRAAIVITGNPVREMVLNGCAAAAFKRFGFAPEIPLVYVTGGALGAHAINVTIAEALPDLLTRIQILHQSGPRAANSDYMSLSTHAATLPEELRRRYHVIERVGDEIGDIFAATSLVIGRAGAGTIAELAAAGLPSILIPLPGAEEQRQNALYLQDAGAAILIDQRDLTAELLVERVTELITSPERLTAMGAAGGKSAPRDPAARIVDALLRLVPTAAPACAP